MALCGANSANVIERYFQRGIDLHKYGMFYLFRVCFSYVHIILLSFLFANIDLGNFYFNIYLVHRSGCCFYYLEHFNNKLSDNSLKPFIQNGNTAYKNKKNYFCIYANV